MRRALAAGLSLAAAARLFRAANESAPARDEERRALAAAVLADVEARLDELAALRDELRALIEPSTVAGP